MRPLIGVRRDQGQRYLLLTIASFAVTVMAVRVYLDMAGYPKVGGGGLHVAHLLWGGLLLVVAALLLQLFVGRRALTLSAVTAGVGVGLFIDEVGKFITESNDYFFAPAAPIIYGGILLLILIWFVLRRDTVPSVPEATQGAIEALRDLADGRLSRRERDRAVERLRAVGASAGGSDLPAELLELLTSPDTDDRLRQPGWLTSGEAGRIFRRLMPDLLERIIIRIGLLLSMLDALTGMFLALLLLVSNVTTLPVPEGPIEYPQETIWIIGLMAVWIVVGTANGVALVLSLFGHHRRGMAIAQYAVLLGLVAGGLLNTYISQLGALSGVLLQLILLLLIIDQRTRLAASAVAESDPPAAQSQPATG